MKEPGFERSEGERSFEEQFADKKSFKVAGGTAEVVDITPASGETGTPVLFAPAWGCTMEVYKPALKTLVGENVRTISFDHPRFGGDMSLAPEEAVKKYPYEEVRKALNITGILDQKSIGYVDAIAHSEASINVLIAAVLHPEKFRNIVLYAPAGLIGKDTFTRLIKGFAGQSKRGESLLSSPKSEYQIPVTETEKEVAAKAATEVLKYFAKNPLRALKEVGAIKNSDILDMLRYLHDEKGIGIGIIHAVDDPVFPMERVQIKKVPGESDEKLKARFEKVRQTKGTPESEQAVAELFGREGNIDPAVIDGFLSVRGGHGEIGNHPERYVTAAKKMLDAIEKKKEEKRRKEEEEPRKRASTER